MASNLYHSALKSRFKTFNDIPPVERFDENGCKGFVHDLTAGLPQEFDAVDVTYSDAPFPQGMKIFNERAKVESTRSYSDFANAIRGIIESASFPIYLTLGKTLLKQLDSPDGTAPISLNGGPVTLAWWHDDYDGPRTTSTDVIRHLGSKYSCMGDFCCGYGASVLEFMASGGNMIVASDFDPKCIAVLKARICNS